MNEMEVSTIGERIKTLRKKRGYNQKDLATLLGKSLRTIQKYESGEIEVSIAMEQFALCLRAGKPCPY